MMNNEEKDLKKYYKNVYICKKCKRYFGSNQKSRNETCPKCENNSWRKPK
ncbi:MAG TPA: hypothetical protein VMZ91_02230 [Candidatus Paceibacterota bacterium]|nr:hypothetical protein [Candidatus Paceibacterota bacterium]